jgi:peroxiredoxin
MNIHIPHASLAPILVECREATPEWTPVYDAFIAGLRANGVGAAAPVEGEVFPDFALPDENGRFRSLDELVAGGPIVVSFNRGGWCPYCRTELSAWAERMPEVTALGGRFVAISGEVGGRAGKLHQFVGASATVLCDVDHGLALALGLTFFCGDDLQKRYLACGLNLADLYGSGGWLLPVPGTFVVTRDKRVAYRFADPDFRIRAEPDDVLAALRKLA